MAMDEIREIEQSLEDIKKGRVYSIEKVAKELGISLKFNSLKKKPHKKDYHKKKE